ncbi:MAG: hypothetical protein IID45_09615, partial [Planctomycetes bacterium]|nr:hypothetical protein [Planctomycetota bacterium]
MNSNPSPTSDTSADEILSPSRRLNALPAAFCLAAVYEIAYGLVMVSAELFVGLHVLAGAGSLVVAFYLQKRNPRACRFGVFLSFAIMSAEIVPLLLSWDELEWPGVVFFGFVSVFFAGLFVTLLTVRRKYALSCPADRSSGRTGLLLVLLIAAGVGVWIYWSPDEPKITISRETTYITEPLDADGFPDYLAAINDRYSKGVTPENNAAVLLLQASGPNEIPEELRAELFKRLGMKPLPERGDYFVSHFEFEKRLRKQGVKLPDENNAITSQWSGLPWKRNDHPLLAQWLDVNRTPTRLAVEASRRTKLSIPLIILTDDEGGEPYPTSLAVRIPISEAARFLHIRAMQHLGEGRPNSARNSAIALHRLARLHAKSCGMFERVLSVAFDDTAHKIDRALIVYGRLTSERALAYQADLYKIKAFPPPDESLDFIDRHFHLYTIVAMARGRWAFEFLFWDLLGIEVWKKCGERMRLRMIDWDVVMKFSNETIDRVVNIARMKNRSDRVVAFDKLKAEFQQISEHNGGLDQYAKWLFTGRGATNWFKISFADHYVFSARFTLKYTDSNRMQYELALLGLGLTAYRADHGEYPETLAKLKPKYARRIP